MPTAQRPVATAPIPNPASPQPATNHHPEWLATAKPDHNGPERPELSTEPTTATPSAAPTWRLVDATAAATLPGCVASRTGPCSCSALIQEQEAREPVSYTHLTLPT